MTPQRFREITEAYSTLRVAVVGDFCLDRYLEIDPVREEISIETGLPVYNITRVRALPGAAGTIFNNLAALGLEALHVVGFCGDDGEGYELRRALAARSGARLEHFFSAPDLHTFTYCKPLLISVGEPPRELNRLDTKNWAPAPVAAQQKLAESVLTLAPQVDAMILMDQVDLPETGVVSRLVREAAHAAQEAHPRLLVLADSRRGLADFPPFAYKMNAAELAALAGVSSSLTPAAAAQPATELARKNGRPVFVTFAADGILAAAPGGSVQHIQARPVRGPIDIVGAGDSVTANLAAALAGGASIGEAMELAMAAASVTIHQLGATGEASVADLSALFAAEA